MTWLRWQAACIADDMRRWRATWKARCRRWNHAGPGPDTGQMRIIELELAGREWIRPTDPEPEPEWTAEALRRAMAPRLYVHHEAYWADRWRDLFTWVAHETAAANQLRAECGLPPRQPVSPFSTVIYQAA